MFSSHLLHKRSFHGSSHDWRLQPHLSNNCTEDTSTTSATVDSGKVRLPRPEECSSHRPQAEGCRSTGRATIPSRTNWHCQALPILMEPKAGRLQVSTQHWNSSSKPKELKMKQELVATSTRSVLEKASTTFPQRHLHMDTSNRISISISRKWDGKDSVCERAHTHTQGSKSAS